MANVYDQHRAAFSNVSAYVVMCGGERVATIAFKFGNAVSAYVLWIGIEMQRGRAMGHGYDRQSAACADAARKMPEALETGMWANGTPCHTDQQKADYAQFRAALMTDDGRRWDDRLRDAGFQVWQAV